MQMETLIQGMDVISVQGHPDRDITGIAYDSRGIQAGNLFVAIRGHRNDGHRFLREAVQKGAVAVVSEDPLPDFLKETGSHGGRGGPAFLRVPDSRAALSRLAVRFYDRPWKGMNLIGITGTNGKTTTSYLLEAILVAAGRSPGVIGTVNYRIPGRAWEATVTTPESLELMGILRIMADSAVTDVVMEVSSHALDQGRVRDCPFDTAVFTNLSRDHLDYHGSMEAYFRAKAILFEDLGKKGEKGACCAVVNLDDPRGRTLLERTAAKVTTYAIREEARIQVQDARVSMEGIEGVLTTPQGSIPFRSGLMGTFNLYNLMASAGAALSLGIGLEAIGQGIRQMQGVPGRLERVPNDRGFTVLVDYGHTPDALEKSLKGLRALTRGRIYTVFGCGGDRDRGKRPEMGRVAGERSDHVLITSDNPRSEDPEAIARDIEGGLQKAGLGNYEIELDRRLAIRRAIDMAREDDLVLIAGKGHEPYQMIGTKRHVFDDRVEAAKALLGGPGLATQ